MDYPKDAIEFHEFFSDEHACRSYLEDLRWPKGFVCPRCLCTEFWKMDHEIYWCRLCSYQCSVTSGTLFQGTRKPLKLWFEAMWYVTNQKNGVSALGLQRVLGLGSYHTAWNWLHKLRRAMVRPGRDKLSGCVEVDELFIGGVRSGKRGRGAAGKQLVLVAVEDKTNGIGRIRLRRIADASGLTLVGATAEIVEPGSTVRTDGWTGYNGLSDRGYQHNIVSKGGSLGNNPLPLVNRIASLLKRWILGTHQGAIQASHLEYYLDEYTFRFNRRTSRARGLLFYRLITQAIDLEPVIEADLKEKPPPIS